MAKEEIVLAPSIDTPLQDSLSQKNTKKQRKKKEAVNGGGEQRKSHKETLKHLWHLGEAQKIILHAHPTAYHRILLSRFHQLLHFSFIFPLDIHLFHVP